MSETKTPQRIVLHTAADGVAIVFPSARNPGAVAFGTLKPDVIYVVSPDEATRLTSEKRSPAHRFDLVDAKASPKKYATGDKE